MFSKFGKGLKHSSSEMTYSLCFILGFSIGMIIKSIEPGGFATYKFCLSMIAVWNFLLFLPSVFPYVSPHQMLEREKL